MCQTLDYGSIFLMVAVVLILNEELNSICSHAIPMFGLVLLVIISRRDAVYFNPAIAKTTTTRKSINPVSAFSLLLISRVFSFSKYALKLSIHFLNNGGLFQ